MLRLDSLTNGRNNNFNLIRLVAAVLVLLSHCYPLTLGADSPDPLSRYTGKTLGQLAVDVFFVTSGFLVTSSLGSRGSIGRFIWARVLRIYPALVVSVIFCAFIVGPIFTKYSTVSYLSAPGTYSFFVWNSSLMGLNVIYHLPGVFESNVYKVAVNGSLWTLPWEIRMYALLALFAVFFRSAKAYGVVLMVVTIGAMHLPNLASGHVAETPYFIAEHFAWLFFFGSSLYFFRDRVLVGKGFFLAALGLFVVLAIFSERSIFHLGYMMLLPYLVICLAYLPGGMVRKFNQLGDFSYGTYLYAFPVQQAISASVPGISVISMFLVALPVTLCLAVASWHLVERPCLALKGRAPRAGRQDSIRNPKEVHQERI